MDDMAGLRPDLEQVEQVIYGVPIRRFDESDTESLVDLLNEAFHHGAVPEYLVAHGKERHDVLKGFFRIQVEHALQHGVAYGTADMTGAALWLDHLGSRSPAVENEQQRMAAACAEWLPRFVYLAELFDKVHPRTPHWYLQFIGVRPTHQNKGIGSALLEFYHRRLDDHGHSAYLEASAVDNRRLYLRTGYTDQRGGPYRLPEGGPNIWPMWREA